MKSERKLVQVVLRSGPGLLRPHLLTCWVEPKVKVGDFITLKDHEDPKQLWEVLRVGIEQSASDIKRGWDNNY